jgi:hypothetical protein
MTKTPNRGTLAAFLAKALRNKKGAKGYIAVRRWETSVSYESLVQKWN